MYNTYMDTAKRIVQHTERGRRMIWQKDNLGWYLVGIEQVMPRLLRFNKKLNKEQTIKLWNSYASNFGLEAAE